MPDTTAENTIEYGSMRWKPKRGATATADEFTSAQTPFNEILGDICWNPWVHDDRADEYDDAPQVIDQ